MQQVNCAFTEQANCEVTGNAQIRAKDGTSAFWYGLHVDDVAGYGALNSVSLAENGNTHECDKSNGPSFWVCNLVNTPIATPIDVTLTDQGGRTLTGSNVITNLNGGAEFDFGSNFGPADLPDSTAGAPTCAPCECFSEESTVDVLTKGRVSMKDVEVFDMVSTGKSAQGETIYQQVYALAHYDTETSSDFLQVSTTTSTYNDNHHPLEITTEHLVFLEGMRHPVKAGSIQVGDILRTADQANATVTNVARVRRQGLYVPLTPDGVLLVDGILASNYVALQTQTSTESVKVGGVRLPFLPQALVFHMTLSPLRGWCMHFSSPSHDWWNICHAMNEQGYHPFVGKAIQLLHWAEWQSNLTQWILFVPSLALISAFYLLEKIVTKSFFTLVALLAATAYHFRATKAYTSKSLGPNE